MNARLIKEFKNYMTALGLDKISGAINEKTKFKEIEKIIRANFSTASATPRAAKKQKNHDFNNLTELKEDPINTSNNKS